MIKTCALVLALFVCCAVADHNLEGEWTDESGYGQSLYVCLNGNRFNAAYSEAGIMVGTTDASGNTASGNWYEGGGDTLSCTTGTFEITYNEQNDRLQGTWECADDDEEHDIDERRLSGGDPTTIECALLASDGSIGGDWLENFYNIAICVDDDDYVASYSYAEDYSDPEYEFRIPGFETGDVYSDLIGSGFYEETKDQGVSLVFLLQTGQLGNFFWNAQKGEELNPNDFDDDSKHGYSVLDFTGNYINQDTCERFSYVEDEYLYDDDDQSRSSSDASAAFAPVALVAGVAVLAAGFLY
mmetsp:Transcript_19752/g.75727  ORF Transcript_19752/g.75727 Transcript_19752/m.75727 type:complete len:299 (+) Transcript_19752:77-973(+)|eukprot:CAMPEP_0114612252 /NCGR_PEP_ID=MMETSP0168-20121206/4528_1 /TAXON_ID=95228 ORGANISM="Vannella sp., Strain DIVA3 517/6/12" /NCGR_SAMPLE_ID=MMETSP0168 /ASSEMBLY_ACC=CAM_ASM_000044 /LENGTH=298 /DNA_ID=CAMNT_0001823235 /DNA_START=56 /DNA_END=952 /DNA_ORIENTATION=-